jgi:hypothetical protein
MSKKSLSVFTGALLITYAGIGFAQELNSPSNEPPKHGIHWARGENPHGEGDAHSSGGATSRTGNMTYHNGPIMQNVTVTPIFWGTSWTSSPGDKISGMDKYYAGVSGTQYDRTNDEYTQTGGAHVTNQVAYTAGTYIVDGTTAGSGASTSTILNEVCKVIKNPQSNGYYPVYTDIPRGSARYCAYHSSGTCGGVRVQFGFFWKLDGDAGCDPQSTVSGQSEGLAALANVSGHELSEMQTDPLGNAWYDGAGNENGDKCAWAFGSSYVTFSNGTQWKVQGNWSNTAYNKGIGYANNSGQHGCIDGSSSYPAVY